MVRLDIKLTAKSFHYLLDINCNNNHEKHAAANIDEYVNNATCKDSLVQLLQHEKLAKPEGFDQAISFSGSSSNNGNICEFTNLNCAIICWGNYNTNDSYVHEFDDIIGCSGCMVNNCLFEHFSGSVLPECPYSIGCRENVYNSDVFANGTSIQQCLSNEESGPTPSAEIMYMAIENSYYGFYGKYWNDVIFKYNNLSNNCVAFKIQNCNNNIIQYNNLFNNSVGINILYSNNDIVQYNNLLNNHIAIHFDN